MTGMTRRFLLGAALAGAASMLPGNAASAADAPEWTVDPAKSFYASLDDKQKARVEELSNRRHRFGGGGGRFMDGPGMGGPGMGGPGMGGPGMGGADRPKP